MDFRKDLKTRREAEWEEADTAGMRRILFKKQNGLCYWCRRPTPPGDRSLDHILHLYLGGPLVTDNLGLTHDKCNKARGWYFSDHLLERLPDSVLRQAIKNLQALPASAYEDEACTDERLARILEARKEMETKLQILLIQRMTKRQESLMKDQEPALERRLEIERKKQLNLSEKDFQKLLVETWKSKIGRCIRRYEKKENLANRPVKRSVSLLRSRKEKHVE